MDLMRLTVQQMVKISYSLLFINVSLEFKGNKSTDVCFGMHWQFSNGGSLFFFSTTAQHELWLPTPISVSYTHLDVYKRQILNWGLQHIIQPSYPRSAPLSASIDLCPQDFLWHILIIWSWPSHCICWAFKNFTVFSCFYRSSIFWLFLIHQSSSSLTEP